MSLKMKVGEIGLPSFPPLICGRSDPYLFERAGMRVVSGAYSSIADSLFGVELTSVRVYNYFIYSDELVEWRVLKENGPVT